MSAHLREAWAKLASEDNGIQIVHLDSSVGHEQSDWPKQQQGVEGHELVLIESQYEGLPRSQQRYLPACICGHSATWYSYSGRLKAAEKFWQYHTKTEPWRTAAFADRLGKCFEVAARYAWDNPDTELVHGSIQGFGLPRLDHAWVDTGSGIFDAVMGQHFGYEAWQGYANPVETDRFTYTELMANLVEYEHWGPW